MTGFLIGVTTLLLTVVVPAVKWARDPKTDRLFVTVLDQDSEHARVTVSVENRGTRAAAFKEATIEIPLSFAATLGRSSAELHGVGNLIAAPNQTTVFFLEGPAESVPRRPIVEKNAVPFRLAIVFVGAKGELREFDRELLSDPPTSPGR